MILPVMALLVTVLHESAHALAVWAQGGMVGDFVWVPSEGHWGYIRYRFPDGRTYSSFAISIAPYCLWMILAALTAMASSVWRTFPFWSGSTLFVWGFCVPLADIANTAFPYLRGRNNDLMRSFGPPTEVAWGAVLMLTVAVCVSAFPIHVRLYGEKRLSLGSYVALASLTLVGIVAVSGAV